MFLVLLSLLTEQACRIVDYIADSSAIHPPYLGGRRWMERGNHSTKLKYVKLTHRLIKLKN